MYNKVQNFAILVSVWQEVYEKPRKNIFRREKTILDGRIPPYKVHTTT